MEDIDKMLEIEEIRQEIREQNPDFSTATIEALAYNEWHLRHAHENARKAKAELFDKFNLD